MWSVMEYKTNSCLPGSFQNNIYNAFLVGTMIPLWKVTIAVTPIGWAPYLNVVYTPTTFDPKIYVVIHNSKYWTHTVGKD